MIRIISGKHKGRRISAPKKFSVRPTTDRAKESLFNILNNHFYFDEIKMLDLCAGTGNITYEAASRGCTDIVAVDVDNTCLKFIEQTIEHLQLEGIQCFRSDIYQFVEQDFRTYDLIFADPPFDYEEYEAFIAKIFEKKMVNKNGMLIVEHRSSFGLEHLPHHIDERKYGNVSFSFFQVVVEE
jgi:16S rRNA (guanine(966)-N(2))-methyltransferase RsmD